MEKELALVLKQPDSGLLPAERAVIAAAAERPISDLSPVELSRELGTALRFIMRDIGCREDNDMQYRVIRIAELLKRYYAAFTIKDFRMAFELALAGELDDFLPKSRDGQPDRNHYQQFNAEYVCKILNAYRSRRGYVFKKAREVMPEERRDVPQSVKDEYHARTLDALRDAYYYFKYRGRMPALSPAAEKLYYDALLAVGLADEIGEVDDGNLLPRMMDYYLRKFGRDDGPHLAVSSVRRKEIERAFRRMVQDEIQIKNYI